MTEENKPIKEDDVIGCDQKLSQILFELAEVYGLETVSISTCKIAREMVKKLNDQKHPLGLVILKNWELMVGTSEDVLENCSEEEREAVKEILEEVERVAREETEANKNESEERVTSDKEDS